MFKYKEKLFCGHLLTVILQFLTNPSHVMEHPRFGKPVIYMYLCIQCLQSPVNQTSIGKKNLCTLAQWHVPLTISLTCADTYHVNNTFIHTFSNHIKRY